MRLGCLVAVVVLSGACSKEKPSVLATSSAMLGPEGGMLKLGELTLEVPAGALGAAQQVTVTETDDPIPKGLRARTHIYRFTPVGLEFAKPAIVKLPRPQTKRPYILWWSAGRGSRFYVVPQKLTETTIEAEVTHFSGGVIGQLVEEAQESVSEVLETVVDEGLTEAGGVVATEAMDAVDAVSAHVSALLDSIADAMSDGLFSLQEAQTANTNALNRRDLLDLGGDPPKGCDSGVGCPLDLLCWKGHCVPPLDAPASEAPPPAAPKIACSPLVSCPEGRDCNDQGQCCKGTDCGSDPRTCTGHRDCLPGQECDGTSGLCVTLRAAAAAVEAAGWDGMLHGCRAAGPVTYGLWPCQQAVGGKIVVYGGPGQVCFTSNGNDPRACVPLVDRGPYYAVEVPPTATSGVVTTTDPTGQTAYEFLYVLPVPTKLLPETAQVGDAIKVIGDGLLQGSIEQVWMRRRGISPPFVAAEFLWLPGGERGFIVPPGAVTGPIWLGLEPEGDVSDKGLVLHLRPRILSVTRDGRAEVQGYNLTMHGFFFSATIDGVEALVSDETEDLQGFLGDGVEQLSVSTIALMKKGSGKLTISTPDGSDTYDLFSETPRIVSFSPMQGSVDTPVTIELERAEIVQAVFLGGRSVPFTMQDDRTVTASVALDSALGPAPIAVVTARGRGESTTPFTVVTRPDPTIATLSPTAGPPGTIVAVQGTGLRYPYAATLGAANAHVEPLLDEQVFVTIPVDAAGGANTLSVCVEVGGGQRVCTSKGPFTVKSETTTTTDPPTLGPCGSTLDYVGTSDFEISMDVVVHAAQQMAIAGQRFSCGGPNPYSWWTVRVGSNGMLGWEMIDLPAGNFRNIGSTKALVQGVPSHIVFRRIAGVFSTEEDGARGPDAAAAPIMDFTTSMVPLQNGVSPCVGVDGTVNLNGMVSNLCIRTAVARCPGVTSTFDSSTGGWSASAATTFEHHPTGGSPDGYLFVDNSEVDACFLYAPPKFRGDLRAFAGGKFSFDANKLGAGGSPWSSSPDDFGFVRISGPGGSMSVDLQPDPAGDPDAVWSHYAIPMTAAAWGQSTEMFDAILANVTELRVSVEALLGEESHGIDNLSLQCP